jgi:hypothetical protein
MRWHVTVDGKTHTLANKYALAAFMENVDWWSINRVEVISEAQPLAQWELDILNGGVQE